MLVDMPLEKLREYQGISPKPADFDEFWDRSLAEMEAVDPQCEMIESKLIQTPYAICYDLFFTGVGGSRIHAKLIRPRKEEDRKGPAVVVFHGYTGSAGEFSSYLQYAAAGFTVAALDCRGQGGYSQDTIPTTGPTLNGAIVRGLSDKDPAKLLFRNIFLDCAQLVKIVSEFPDVDKKRIGVFGGSQGGALTLAAAALAPYINRAAPLYPFLCDYRRVWEMDLAKDAYLELKTYFRHFDPRHEREDEIFMRLGYIDVQNLAPRIRGKVMMFTGMMDTICPPSSQFAAFNKITSPKCTKIYPDFGHENLPQSADLTLGFMLEMLEE